MVPFILLHAKCYIAIKIREKYLVDLKHLLVSQSEKSKEHNRAQCSSAHMSIFIKKKKKPASLD